jgi:hypothetical protein
MVIYYVFQMDRKYTNIFRSKALQDITQMAFLDSKNIIWQPWYGLPARHREF